MASLCTSSEAYVAWLVCVPDHVRTLRGLSVYKLRGAHCVACLCTSSEVHVAWLVCVPAQRRRYEYIAWLVCEPQRRTQPASNVHA